MGMRQWQIAGAAGVFLLGGGAGHAGSPDTATAPAAEQAARAPDIYRGEVASSAVFTWQVGIAIGPGGRCGGVVISRNHVLTAAHCLDRADQTQLSQPLAPGSVAQSHVPATIRILHGSDTWETGRPMVARIAFHPGWRAPAHAARQDFDAAIITLREPLDTAGALVRSAPVDKVADAGWVSGWGGHLLLGNGGSERLLAARVQLIDNSACVSEQTRPTLTANKLCAGDPDRATCAGDSGGPLVIGELGRIQLVGIVHAGARRCGLPATTADDTRHISIYMRSAAIADWIVRETGGQAQLTAANPGPLFTMPRADGI
jgi:hypothetical protein